MTHKLSYLWGHLIFWQFLFSVDRPTNQRYYKKISCLLPQSYTKDCLECPSCHMYGSYYITFSGGNVSTACLNQLQCHLSGAVGNGYYVPKDPVQPNFVTTLHYGKICVKRKIERKKITLRIKTTFSTLYTFGKYTLLRSNLWSRADLSIYTVFPATVNLLWAP